MTQHDPALRRFVAESNRIEGITRPPSNAEIKAHEAFLGYPGLCVADFKSFVDIIAPGHGIRDQPHLNVRVGNHVAPQGGSDIPIRLHGILAIPHPFDQHVAYEKLHPFTDGNGRSGRVLWLRSMLRQGRDPYALQRGFLHTFYYQTLSNSRVPTP